MKLDGKLGKLVIAALALSLVFMSTACSRCTETVTKKAVEKTTGVSVDEDEGSVKIKTDEGEAEIESGKNELPDDFPDDFPIYKGAKVASSTKMSVDEGTSFHVSLEVKGSVDTVADYYKEELVDAGYTISSTMETNGNVMYTLQDDGVVQVVDQDGKTMVQVTLVEKQ